MAYLEFEPREPLFQFTSVEGFKGIIDSKALWFSDLKSLNDPREVIFGLGRIRTVVEQVIDGNSGFDRSIVGPVLEYCYKYVKQTNLYTCSFCPVGDLMPLWQHYGNQGAGLAIGFRPRSIMDIPARVQKVEYVNERTSTEDLKVKLASVLEPFLRLKVSPTLEQKLDIASTIAASCTSTKHSSWEHEREIRAVYAQSSQKEATNFLSNITSMNADGSVHKWRDPLVRESQVGEVKYLPFKFGKMSGGNFDFSGAIHTVFVGSKSSISAPEVESLLKSEGFRNFEVIPSECIWR
ncbi:hypothetical protein PhaeoP83_00958 [Phaeobacter inhibens]|uniref:DUF2971 domain-containing protein n=1 Tax=Phaeobacter inhibens TaxID=221822 RepID=A0ABN5GJY9_9RHOB|nr:DUF2971 domain-containing protein [Phaeobacter inhibens]AUQ49255.1 hypothetical protein PhaeoP83_00958 [Phaeobacter inhibens]AUQ93755.1 hypothetical protein PhaeoP66_00951 [Phaeobacter inhibens]AUR04377.1 hypothetical protein PhaeoP72_02419 [Phaeobacter inhibens]AUR19058.1 hypothetical protein PhaeoP80_00958 [Phaeobacter inhibens]